MIPSGTGGTQGSTDQYNHGGVRMTSGSATTGTENLTSEVESVGAESLDETREPKTST